MKHARQPNDVRFALVAKNAPSLEAVEDTDHDALRLAGAFKHGQTQLSAALALSVRR